MAIATELWLVVIVARVVAEIGQVSAVKAMFADQIANAPKDTPKETLDVWQTMSSTGFVVAMLIVGAVIVGTLTLLLMWFARKGYNIARLLLAGASMYVVVSMIWELLILGVQPRWVAVPLIVAGVAGGGALVALMRRDTETWCADMALFRRQSKVIAAMPAAPMWPPMPATPPARNEQEYDQRDR